MLAHTRRLVRRALLTLLLLLLTAWAVIAYFAWQAAPLQLWHTVVPPNSVSMSSIAATGKPI